MNKKGRLEFDILLSKLEYMSNINDINKVKKACNLLIKTQCFNTDKPRSNYIIRQLKIAEIIASLHFDCDCVIAGLLYNYMENENANIKEISDNFGYNVVYLIDIFTKIIEQENNANEESKADVFETLLTDPRLIIIKLCIRLHDMRMLKNSPIEKREKIAKETLELYTPLAHRLGLYNIKSELEDLSLRYIEPDLFYDIVEKINLSKKERNDYINGMVDEMMALLDAHDIKYSIKGRIKNIYSINKKLEKGKDFNELYDLLALRIIVEDDVDCYKCLDLINEKYKTLSNRFKDYIANPKNNNYQSIHMGVEGKDNMLFEVQIRTVAMDKYAEDGMASHWSYKNVKKQLINVSEDLKINTVKSEIKRYKASREILGTTLVTKVEEKMNNIVTYTPKGDIIELPYGSTPIDFAHKIHTDIGNYMTGTFVNGVAVGLDYKLKDNDKVFITVSKDSIIDYSWVDIAKTKAAKHNIKSYLSKCDLLAQKQNLIDQRSRLIDKIDELKNMKKK